MLRKRGNKRYVEETSDEKDEGGRTYNLKEKIRSPRFEQLRDLQVCPGEAVSLRQVQKDGFDKPILVESPAGLNLRVPPKSFTVRDVGKLVGHDRLIDVMDVRTQKNIEMTMKEWCKYYDTRQRDRLLNVISLEFSHTDLDDLIDSPQIVRHLDWVDMVWPKFLKESQTESTNKIDRMKYPKVQKYCLMSVKGSYTDFHIDFGGTSVWYHILRGKKIFWMCPPTELNMQAFEEWTLSGMQQDVFFGDTVEECFRVELCAGNTFFIPSGWIHAVYTVEDSLVFGGNFLHSFGIENQLKVSRIEDATKVPLKFRYPFYTEILWYVVQHYVHCLTGKSHLHSTTSTPEKSSQKSAEKRKQISRSGDTTESEQDESDNKKQKALRKRGKQATKSSQARKQKKPPTDDESTEIDSDLEDVKPSKSTATCRMTKNSLLRLQYEIDEPKSTTNALDKTPDEKAPKRSHKETLSSPNKNDSHVSHTDLSLSTDSNRSNLSQLILSQEAVRATAGWSSGQQVWSHRESESKEPPKIHITKYEVNGLRILVKYLSKLSGAKKNLPALIRNSRHLLDDCKKIIAEHENDDPELAATGVPITLDLLNPKKSDISQLIEQFFKAPDSTAADGAPSLDSPNSARSKCDSTTLTQQQRLKYMQPSVETKSQDKKGLNSVPLEANSSGSIVSNKDHKNQPHAKKLSTLSSPSAAADSQTSADLPRPKSPPTRPVSNKQYTSKTKKDVAVDLPGSFADLIAATSAPKEVFNVSSAEVTSSLFGLKPSSPNKNTSSVPKIKQRASSSDASSTKVQSDQDHDARNPLPLPGTKTPSEPISKTISPEPPKVQPPKRFINPTYRPQAKEKLVFASAPYVSPAHNLEPPRSLHSYPWQSPASFQPPNLQRPSQPAQQPTSQHSPTIRQATPQSSNATPSPEPGKRSSTVIGSLPVKQEYTHKAINEKMDVSIRPINAIQTATKYKPKDRIADPDSGRNYTCQKPENSSIDSKSQNLSASPKNGPSGSVQSDHTSSMITKQQSSSFSIDRLMAPSGDKDGNEEPKKSVTPRGPIKKSKEARQVLEAEAEKCAGAPIPVSVVITNPSVITPASPLQSNSQTSLESSSKTKKTKRPKKKAGDETQSSKPPPSQTPASATQTLPQVICRLVPPVTISSANSANAPSKSSPHQYLISRPVLFNSMQPFSTAHLQQHVSQPALPILTTAVASTGATSVAQPRARLVWATRPPASTVPGSKVSSASAQSTSSQKSEPSRPLPQRQTDHNALLSLATTALSTAPLPTTPTLSHVGARGPSVSQAFMMNPMVASQPGIFAGQQLFNPYLPQMPLLARPPFILAGNPSHIVPGGPPKPNAPRPTGQLLFAPLPRPTSQPRYLITPPGFLPHRPQTSQLFATQQVPTTLAFAPYRPPVVNTTESESVKVKKVKTR